MGVWYGDVYVGISKFGSLQFKAIPSKTLRILYLLFLLGPDG